MIHLVKKGLHILFAHWIDEDKDLVEEHLTEVQLGLFNQLMKGEAKGCIRLKC